MEVDGFEDGTLTKVMFSKLQIIELGCLIVSLFGLALIVVQVTTLLNFPNGLYNTSGFE